MVNFETQVYQREGNTIIGAEVLVYADTGERIGNIIITNETDYEALVNRLDGIVNECVGYNSGSSLTGETIETILANISEATTINATKLGGLQSDQYTKLGHTHSKNDITNLYNYDLSLSDYNPELDEEVTVTVKVTKQNNSAVANQNIVITKDNATWKTGFTNNNGIYTAKFTPNETGLVTFSVQNQKVQMNVRGWETVSTNINGSILKVNRSLKLARLIGEKTVTFSNINNIELGSIPASYRPLKTVREWVHDSLDRPVIMWIKNGGQVSLKTTSTGQNARTCDWDILWAFG